MSDPLTLRDLSDPARIAVTVALISIAAADGVADDEEIAPLVGSLGLHELDADARRRVARALLQPEPIEALGVLEDAPVLVRAGLMLRMVEVVGADGVIAPGEVARLEASGRALRVTDDQIGAMRAFLDDLGHAGSRGPSDVAWYRILVRAGGTLLAAGVPAGAVTWCGIVRRSHPLGPLERGLGVPTGTLKHWLGDGPHAAPEQLLLLAAALEEEAADCPDRLERKAMGLRARALQRLARQPR